MTDDFVNIYDMKLHEVKLISINSPFIYKQFMVTRVPGGWLYQQYNVAVENNGIFVPYHDEFRNYSFNQAPRQS